MTCRNEMIVGVFDPNNRGNKIRQPLKSVDIDFDKILHSKNKGFSQIIREIKNFCTLGLLTLKSIYKRKNLIILTESTGRDLFICTIFSQLPGNKIILRLRGHLFREREGKNIRDDGVLRTLESKINELLDKATFKHCDLILPVSNWLSDSIIEETDLTKSSIKVVRTPQLKDIKKKNQYDFKEEFRFIAVTNFVFQKKVKGMTEFIERFSDFLETRNIKIDIAGSGQLEKKFQDIETKAINLLGYVDNIEEVYREYDGFIHFSYLDAYPSTVLEAQAAGLPVIVNNCCGMKEQVEDGETGFIVDLDDEEEVKKKILKLKNSKELRKRLGKNGYEKVKKENNYEKIGRELKEAIEEFMEDQSKL